MRFDDLKLTRQFLNAIADAGYENATPIQQKAIPPLRAGQDVIGIAQTGTGKTAAFLLPLLQTLKYAQGEAPRGLVLAPTKELVVQIHQEALKLQPTPTCALSHFMAAWDRKSKLKKSQTVWI